MAAAGGRSVPDRLLAAVAGLDERALDAALREAVEHHVLVVDETGTGGYEFRHTLTRDAIYRDALPRERARIHATYARALSADPSLAGTGATVPAELALHWTMAHDVPRALPACVEAARLAAGYAPAEALRHLERALEMWPSVPDAEERCGVDVVEVLRRAGLAAYGGGSIDRSIALFDEALGALGPAADPERRALLIESRAQALLDLGRTEEATAALELAASLLPAEPPTVARAVVLASLAIRRNMDGRYDDAASIAERAVAAAQGAGAREQEPNARITLGISRAYVGRSEEGLALVRQGRELAEADGDFATAVRALLNEADQLDMISRYEEAAEAARRGLELARRAGLERGTLGVYLTQNLCESLFHLGRWEEAERLLTDAADARPAGYLAGLLLQLRGLIRVLSGRDGDAAEDIRAASRLNLESVDYQFELPGQFGRAELARLRGDLGEAREHVRIALDVAESMVRYRWPLVWLGHRIEAEARRPRPVGRRPGRPPRPPALMMGSDLARAGCMAALAAVAMTGAPIVLAPALAALSTAAGAAYPPCVLALIPRLAGEDDLPAANTARVTIMHVCIVLGPVLGAGLLLVGPPALAFLVNGATFLAGATAVAALPRTALRRPEVQTEQPGLRAGWDALRRYPDALALVGAEVVASAAYGALTVLFVLLSDRLGLGAAGYGHLIAAVGVGAVLSAGVAERAARLGRPRLPLAAAVLMIGAPLPIAIAGWVPGVLLVAAATGAGSLVSEVVADTALQRSLDPAVFARAYGLVLPAALAGIVLGALLAPLCVALVGLDGTLIVVAVVCTAYAIPVASPAWGDARETAAA